MPVGAMLRDSTAQTDRRDDTQLLRAIARERDQAAFSELLRRYEGDAYSLALRISGQCEAAEDIVQEVMVRVWRNAATYRGDGAVRSWLLRSVARESINTIKKLKRISSKMKSEPADRPSEGPSPQRDAESAELAAALHREFDRLPELERQLLGLHYGGGLSQQEISDALAIPQQTISNHLNRTLKALRSTLSAAGYTILPLAAAEGLGDALCSGAKAPHSLQSRVLAKVASNAAAACSKRMRGPRPVQSNARLVAGAAAIIVLAGGLWFVFLKPSATLPPVAPAPAAAAYDWHRHWTFEKGLPADLQFISGNYKWNQTEKTLECPGRGEFFATHYLPRAPLLFTMKCRIIDLSKPFFFHQSLVLSDKSAGPEPQESNGFAAHSNVSTPEFVRQLYIYGRFWVTTVNGELSSVAEIDRAAEGNIFRFAFENLALEELTATPVNEDELPDYVRHPKLNANK